MKSVIFCGSSKFMEEMKDWGVYLEENGVNVFIPEDFRSEPRWSGTEAEQREIALELTQDHCDRIPNYDVVFIFNKAGYSGVSSTLEIGCAYGNGKEIYAMHHDVDEICRDVLFSKICATKEELLVVLQS